MDIRVILSVLALISVLSNRSEASSSLKFRVGELNTTNLQALTNQLQSMSAGQDLGITTHYVVQFADKAGTAEREVLTTLGAQVIRYIPDNAFLIQTKLKPEQLKNLNGVQVVIPYMGFLKISPAVGPRNVFNAQEKTRLLVTLTSVEAKEKLKAALAGGRILSESENAAILEVPMKQVDAISKIDGVEYVQPYVAPTFMAIDLLETAPVAPQDGAGDYTDLTGYESGAKVMRFPYAWNQGLHGENQKVAMADTGLDTGVVGTLPGDFSGVSGGEAFGIFSEDWSDPMGHGTHVGGSVVGNGAASGGKILGGAYMAKLHVQGMWSPIFNNLTVPPDISTLFQSAKTNGASIHTNSWGSAKDLGSYDAMAAQVDDFMFKNPDFLVIFAAGNSGADKNADGKIDSGSISSPGTAKNALTVGASENLVDKGGIQKKLKETKGKDSWPVPPLSEDTLSNNPNGIAAFSSRGPTKDGRIKPEVVAPGTNILSDCSSVQGASQLWGAYNSKYCWSGGTSMATPLTAGAAAVVREFLQKQGVTTPSAALVKSVLMSTADELFPGQYGTGPGQEILTVAPNGDEGYGRVNVAFSTAKPDAKFFLGLEDNSSGLAEGQTFELPITVDEAENIKVTLVYTDAPGSPAAAQSLVNDLDLQVTGTDGSKLNSASKIDNKEQIIVPNTAGKSFVVKVIATRVAQGNTFGKQPFALVVHRLTKSQQAQLPSN